MSELRSLPAHYINSEVLGNQEGFTHVTRVDGQEVRNYIVEQGAE